jgi:non-specific serine/threonine protein kinase
MLALVVAAVAGIATLVIVVAGLRPGTPRPPLAVEGAWRTIEAAPIALTEVAVAAHNGRIWIAGGLHSDGTASDEVFAYDPATRRWTAGPRLPEAVHHAALVSDGADLVLLGGYEVDGQIAGVRRLDDEAGTWTDHVPLPAPRAAGAAAFDGNRIVFAGGVQPGSIRSEIFALAGGAWRQIGHLSKAREHLAATSDGDGRTFILGGRVGGLGSNLGTADLADGELVTALGDLPTPRGGVGAFWWPSLGACLAGGESPGGTNAQVDCIAADGTVVRLPDLGVARHGVGAAVVDGTAYVVLGGRRPGLFTSDVTETLALP